MRNIILLVLAAGIFITIADVGTQAQFAYPDQPVWVLIALADLCLAALVYKLWKRRIPGDN